MLTQWDIRDLSSSPGPTSTPDATFIYSTNIYWTPGTVLGVGDKSVDKRDQKNSYLIEKQWGEKTVNQCDKLIVKLPKYFMPAHYFLWEMRGLDQMVLEVPADLALRASLAPAASKPALFLGDRPLVCPVSGE